MKTPDKIKRLVELFHKNNKEYKTQSYKEAQLRQTFLDPFFEELGWDVYNKNQFPPSRREVIIEQTVEMSEDQTKRKKSADYCFLHQKKIQFFAEAKKPAVSLSSNKEAAIQLRRYGWSAKVPFSILTDFEEFSIYRCQTEPNSKDSPKKERLDYILYTDYETKWDDIYNIFSKEAVINGSLQQYFEANKQLRGIIEVDEAFLKQMNEWREILAADILKNNQQIHLTQAHLNYAVQMTLDRIIFLRICEDRDIEPYRQVLNLFQGSHIYQRLLDLFKKADRKYNSGLFHFFKEKKRDEPDKLTPQLQISDTALRTIITHLYPPESNYQFEYIPIEIIGHVYEQFLGKVITIQGEGMKKTVTIDDKPEVRKAGGVYYTPTYIVDYIVENTLGRLLQDKVNVEQAKEIKILDPACGSGSFLIGAYTYLLNWYRDQFKRELSIEEKKEILLNHIYGVDLDSQAVEVTKLSLLLKALEGETSNSLAQEERFQRRALPDLSDNIKCGNSLIDTDYISQNIAEAMRVRAFNWQSEFPKIMTRGGFDVVIGNPPYVRQELLGNTKNYLQKIYKTYHGVADLYTYFIEKGLNLLRLGGYFGYIVANKWLRTNYGRPLRKWLKERHIIKLIDFGDLPVFKGATTYPCILLLSNEIKTEKFETAKIRTLIFDNLQDHINDNCYHVDQTSLSETDGWSLISISAQSVFDKLNNHGIILDNYVKGNIYRGIVTGFNKAFIINKNMFDKFVSQNDSHNEIIKPFLTGRDIKRYNPLKNSQYIIFTRRGINIDDYPIIKQYLNQYKEQLMPKPKEWKGKWKGRKPGSYQWYEIQDTIDYYLEFDKPKIIYPNICKRPEFTFDKLGFYTNQKCFIIPVNDKYLLGILNSSITFFLFRTILPKLRGNFYEPSYVYMKNFPIYQIDPDNPEELTRHDKIAGLVETMLSLHERLAEENIPGNKKVIQTQIESIDRQIDRLVYELYGLNEAEIEIIEENY